MILYLPYLFASLYPQISSFVLNKPLPLHTTVPELLFLLLLWQNLSFTDVSDIM